MVKSDNSRGERKPKAPRLDWEQLRAKSLENGGFGDERVDIWPRLLNISHSKDSGDDKPDEDSSLEQQPPHQDERQIGLDTDRSFVLYPVEPKCDRELLQANLNKLLVSVFRKRPRLSYFQGYHDIVTVLFLTLPPETRLLCVEKLSLHRLRDSMGSGLEPVLGLLRVTKNLLQLADPEYSQLLERNSPLPFYALSNLLTLFSHDMPTLPLIQHVFDYLFCRPPIAVVYLAASIILSRKKEVLQYEAEDEDGMVHSLLSSLPNLMDDLHEQNPIPDEPDISKGESLADANDNTFFKQEDEDQYVPSPLITNDEPEPSVKVELDDKISDDIPVLSSIPDVDEHSFGNGDPSGSPLEHQDKVSVSKKDENPPKEETVDGDSISEISPPEVVAPSNVLEDDDEPKEEDHPPPTPTIHSSILHTRPESLILTDLLKHADALYKEFPPSHPGLALSSIMGPQSVVFTWSESFSDLPSDSTAEAMVAHPQLVVYPYVEIDPHQKEFSDKEDKEATSNSKAQRRRRKVKKSPFGHMEKKTVLAGTVLVLGVAMAVYGIKARNNPNGHGLLYVASDGGRGQKDWRRVGKWVGGALAGISQKVINGLSSDS